MNKKSATVPVFRQAARSIVWFRNDLRINDNNVIFESFKSNPAEVLFLYCFDPRHYKTTSFSSKKTGHFRSQFLIESVQNLRDNLKLRGHNLLVAFDRPEDVISNFLQANQDKSTNIFVQGESAYEERGVENSVEQRATALSTASATVKLVKIKGNSTLYHPDDIPFRSDLKDIPDSFTPFKDKVEKACDVRSYISANSIDWTSVRSVTEAVTSTVYKKSDVLVNGFEYMPTLEDLGFTSEEVMIARDAPDSRGVMQFKGGENAALLRLDDWMFKGDNLKNYFDIRNGMLGESYSSKLSPWLALGCISPRLIAQEIKRYEKLRGISNKSTYWLLFELTWRDFFYYMVSKHGVNIFKVGGAHKVSKTWSRDPLAIQRWKTGATGSPLVDANMRELLQTGWMSNRGRQNVASYLILEMGIDWRVGADHFESLLLDHDVYSNYGNWNAAAGLTGGRVNQFNITKQSKDYDPKGQYIKHWVTELQKLSVPHLFEPWKLPKDAQNQLSYPGNPSESAVKVQPVQHANSVHVNKGPAINNSVFGVRNFSSVASSSLKDDTEPQQVLPQRSSTSGSFGKRGHASNLNSRRSRVQHL